MPKITSIQIIDNTKEVLEAMKEQVLIGLDSVGHEAEGYAKDECPVDTGLLRNSITHAVSGQPAAIGSYKADKGEGHGSYQGVAPKDAMPAVYIGTNVEYAEEQEYGSYNHKVGKKHFLKDAATNHTDHYKAIMQAALEK